MKTICPNIVLLLPLLAVAALAQSTPTSTNWQTASGDFNVAGNWDNGVPGATTSTFITNGGVANLNGNGRVGSLTLGLSNTLNVNPGSVLTVSGPTLSNAGSIFLNASPNGTAGILSCGGDTTLSGGGSITLTSLAGNGAISCVQSSGSGDHGMPLVLVNVDNTIVGAGVIGYGSLSVDNAGLIEANGGTLTFYGILNTVFNRGIVQVDPGATLSLIGSDVGPTLMNIGTIKWNGNISGGPSSLPGEILNLPAGLIEVQGPGNVTMGDSSLVNGGQVRLSEVMNLRNGGTLRMSGTGVASIFCPFDNWGTVEVRSGVLEINGTQFTNSGTISISPGAQVLVNGSPLAPPAITGQPQNQAVSDGADAVFTVVATGAPAPAYQWQVSPNGGGAWVDVAETMQYVRYSGTTTDTLTIIGVTPVMNDYQYRCVATNGVSPNATSLAATLTIVGLSDQAFLQQLFEDVLGRPIDPGGSASFGAALAGGESRADVLSSLLGSTEYSLRQIEPLIRLYYGAFARIPDQAGLKNWSNALQAGALTLTGAADSFATSPEFLQTYGNLTDPQFVTLLYEHVLGREPDPTGLQSWLNVLAGGASRGTVVVGFSESPEFQTDMTNQVEIIRLYFLLLQRMPTADELQSWLGFLQGCDQTDALFAQGYPAGLAPSDYVQLVFQGFLLRPAYSDALSSALTAGTATHGSVVNTLLSSAEFNAYVGPVSRLYLAAFRRVPDAGGLDNWVGYLRTGNSLQSVADAFVASEEFQLTYGSLDDTQYVTLLYENVLGRQPDSAGLADWVGQLGLGATRGHVLIGFSESQEGIGLSAPTVRTFLQYFTFLNATPSQSDLDYWHYYLGTLDDQMRVDLFADSAFADGN